MNFGIISARYAKALYAYAVENGAEDAVYSSMRSLVRAPGELKELTQFLRNPTLSSAKRVEIICSAMQASSVIVRFVNLIVKEGREELLIFIAYEYIALYREKKGVYAVKIITATQPDEELRARIELMLDTYGKNIEAEYIVDNSIIGGFRIEADYERIDASVKAQLSRIRKELVEKNNRIV